MLLLPLTRPSSRRRAAALVAATLRSRNVVICASPNPLPTVATSATLSSATTTTITPTTPESSSTSASPSTAASTNSPSVTPPEHWTRGFSVWPRSTDKPSPSKSRKESPRSRDPQIGLNTPVPDHEIVKSSSPFYFEAGYAGWAKRPSRPFPPPFFSPPSGSFSDPLSTTNRSMDRRAKVNGEMIRGVTNGDDAMLVSENLIGTNDGVGQWATRERGHAPLWSRLILHFWALAVEQDKFGGDGPPDPVRYLEESYRMTQEALSEPNEWLGTTTSSLAQLHSIDEKPLLYVTQLGDCRIMVVRQSSRQVIFTTEEQWHYFDCPRQLGTNSPDTPRENATLSEVPLHEDDVVLAMSDGVTDNLWEEDITESVLTALSQWQEEQGQSRPQQQQKKDEEDVIIEEVGQQQQPEEAAAAGASSPSSSSSLAEAMRHVAQQVVLRARRIAEDPFAASPFMEKGVEEGLAIEGGKMDDISVVAAVVCRRPKG